ncbi:MAG: hypothetical protein GEU96_07075 [Propionibacteriales bacterium]|nr:hypothetical protein [Propionibacteriales bacterium]
MDHRLVRVAVRPDQRLLCGLLGVPRALPLRQHEARHRRGRAGVLDVLVGVDDVRDRHGHRADVLGRCRAAHPPQHPADGPGGGGVAGGRAALDGVHLLPLGLPPVGDVRRDRAGDRVLRVPQGLRQPDQLDLLPAARRPRGRRPRQGDRHRRDLRTLFGSATSLGLGALQITGGIDNVFGSGGGSKTLAVVVIAVLTSCFVISAASGIERGIKWLSNTNALAAGLLVLFLFVVGPTVFILGTFTESIGGYLTRLPTMSFRTGVFEGAEWLNGWTIFYWAWWISWTPFVGMFIARISKGRTIRQFVIFVIAIPSLVSFIWFAILGGAAFDLQLNQGVDMPAALEGGIENALFETLREFPLASVTVTLAIFLIAIFFVTGADSASIVMGMLSQRGTEEPQRSLIVFWGVATGAVAAVLLVAGGLEALQRLVIIVAGPFLLILVAMCVSLIKALREETRESKRAPKVRRTVQHAERPE